MKFELSKSYFGVEDIPSLIISATEFSDFSYKGKDEKKIQKIDEAHTSLQWVIGMYSAYCGRKMFMPSAVLRRICDSIEKDGEIVINCIETGEDPKFCCRWISHGKETDIEFSLFHVVEE